MKQLIITVSFLLASCAGFVPNKTDPVFIQYIERFENDTQRTVTVPITFMSNKEYAGWCKTYSNGYRLIEIDHEYWQNSDDLAKEQLIYHELGHCVLNRGHSNTLVPHPEYGYNIPNSIMYFRAFGGSLFYGDYRSHYIEELNNPEKRL